MRTPRGLLGYWVIGLLGRLALFSATVALLVAGCTPPVETALSGDAHEAPTPAAPSVPTLLPEPTTAPTPTATPEPTRPPSTEWVEYTLKNLGIVVAIPAEWQWDVKPADERAAAITVETGRVEFRTHAEYDAFPEAYFKEQDSQMQQQAGYRKVDISRVDAPGFVGSPSAQWRYRSGDTEVLRHDIYFADRIYSLRLEAPATDFARLFPPERIAELVKRWQPMGEVVGGSE